MVLRCRRRDDADAGRVPVVQFATVVVVVVVHVVVVVDPRAS